jgi:hypothetical protein
MSYFIIHFALQEVERQVAAKYAEEIGAIFLETSAKEDTNVQDIFAKLSKHDSCYEQSKQLLKITFWIVFVQVLCCQQLLFLSRM